MAGNGNSGRKRRPTQLILVEGREGRIRDRLAREPVSKGSLQVEPPEHFDAKQRAAWIYAVKHAPVGLLKALDLSVMAVWCVAWCMHQEATVALQCGPRIVKTPNGAVQQSPWVGILNKSAREIRSTASELGFSPAARARVSIDGSDHIEDPTDWYFGDR